MRKVLNVEPYGYSSEAISLWKKLKYEYISTSWDQVYEHGVYPEVEILIVRLDRKIDYKELSPFPDLEIVISATTGLDHLNMKALDEKGIRLVSLRGEDDFLTTIPSTAEHTWALIQSIVRNIPIASADVRLGNWDRDRFRGHQLKDKTIGIIGLGRTGGRVAKYAQAFDMKVEYYDPFVDNHTYTKANSLDTLLERSDIVSIHVHLNEQTHHLLNIENIKKIKRGGYIINTSRAGIWDEESIVEALRSGDIDGVATDVLSTELKEIKQSPLWKASQEYANILITPHLGGATWDAMWACEEYLVKFVENEF